MVTKAELEARNIELVTKDETDNYNSEMIEMAGIGVDYDKFLIRKKQYIFLLKENKIEDTEEFIIQYTAKIGSKQSDEEYREVMCFIFNKDVELPSADVL